jgi:hypothetical protein
MYRQRTRFLFALLCLIALCSAAQATTLQLNVQDSLDNTSISHATVFLDGTNLGRTTNSGEFLISNSGLNDFKIQISMTGYDDWSNTIAANATSAIAYMNRKSLTLNIKTFDSDTILPVYGATINLTANNITQTKQTDVLGSATFGVTAMTLYSVDLTAQNYQPRHGTIDVADINKEVTYWLLSGSRFSFVVNDKDGSTPISAAEVRIDSVLVGTTDSRGILITPVTRGKFYTIQIKKDGYETFAESRMITDTDALYEAVLSKAPVGAIVFVSDQSKAPLSNADVYINGTIVGTTNQYGRANLPNLLSGTYSVEVRKAGYATTIQKVNVTKAGNDIAIEMPFETVGLTIFVQDRDQKNIPSANIIVNGANAGASDTHGQFTTNLIYNTSYNITATKDGYLPTTVQKQVPMGNTSPTLTLTLEKNTDWSLITLVGIGIIIVLALFAVIRILGHRHKRHVVIRKNEL